MLVPVARGDQDVGGLDVAMHEPVVVRLGQGGGDLGDDRDRARRLEPLLLREQRAEVGALDVAHGEVERPALRARVEDRHHVRMIQACGQPALALEARAEDGIPGQRRHEEFQRDGPVEGQVGGPVDHAHAAAPATASMRWPAKVEPIASSAAGSGAAASAAAGGSPAARRGGG